MKGRESMMNLGKETETLEFKKSTGEIKAARFINGEGLYSARWSEEKLHMGSTEVTGDD